MNQLSFPGADRGRINGALAVSVVVPVFNEQANVAPLVDAVREALGSAAWELVLVDDGSTDETVPAAQAEAERDPRVRLVRLARNYGQTPAMQAGFDAARGSVVVSMDGDLQNDPADIPMLIARLEEGFDLVSGYRVRRQDKMVTRLIPSWIANRLIRWVTGVRIRDNGCSLKAYRREMLDKLHLYSDMHRFIPAVAAATAGARIAEVPVRHHARRFGTSKYGLSRILKVLADLLTVMMIRSFRERPLVMLAAGATASLLLAAAGAVLAVLAPGMVVFGTVSLLWAGLACYLLLLGLIGEVALRTDWNEDRSSVPLVNGEKR